MPEGFSICRAALNLAAAELWYSHPIAALWTVGGMALVTGAVFGWAIPRRRR